MASSSSNDCFHLKEVEREIEAILTGKDEKEICKADELIEKIRHIEDPIAATRYFFGVILYYNRFAILEKRSLFPRFTEYTDRLKKSLAVLENELFVRNMIMKEEVPQYPSIFIYAITGLIIAKKVHTKAAYHRKLGEAWLLPGKELFLLPSIPSLEDFPSPETDVEVDIRTLLAGQADLFLVRLTRAVAYIKSFVDESSQSPPSVHSAPVIDLIEAITKLCSISRGKLQSNPMYVLDQRAELCKLASKTRNASIFHEVNDICNNFDKEYYKYF